MDAGLTRFPRLSFLPRVTAAIRFTVLAMSVLLFAPHASSDISLPLASLQIPTTASLDTVWVLGEKGVGIVPIAIDVHPSGTVWGISGSRHQLFRIDSATGEAHLASGGEGDRSPGFASRLFARSGLKLFTLDPWEAIIDRFDLTGYRETRIDLRESLASTGEVVGEWADFCLSRSGDLYLLDGERGRVLQFDDRGDFRRAIGELEEIGFHSPVALEVDGQGRLYLLETRTPALVLLDLDGPRRRRALPAGAAGEITPVALAVDPWGTAFIGDRKSGQVLVLPADESPSWWITLPEGILGLSDLATDGGRRLWVADAAGQRICVYRLGYQERERARDGIGERR